MNSARTNLTWPRAKRHAAWLLHDAEEDEEYERPGRRARARRNRQRRLYVTARHQGDRPYAVAVARGLAELGG
jgi:hypothetical protein